MDIPGESGFNPRTPCGVRPHQCGGIFPGAQFQSTHSLRSATFPFGIENVQQVVSIHALLAECDYIVNVNVNVPCGFNPRTPCGVRPITRKQADMPILFQSTHSLRSATRVLSFPLEPTKFQSTHSLRSATGRSRREPRHCEGFNPRTPCGVRLMDLAAAVDSGNVSIHALLAECDSGNRAIGYLDSGFNPRTPCGVRPSLPRWPSPYQSFQSTHSLRSATEIKEEGELKCEVSIHALLAECDP